jgi:cytochrome bd ubiquinol oxidase subunit II
MAIFWTGALALSLLLYVLLDGFDLGVGMLFPFAPSERARRHMLTAISPVWDGNETWLVLAAATLFGAFPLVYAVTVSAFYLPVLLMLAALILRGVAFEYRYKSSRMRPVWDAGFVGGSYLAAFMQGTMVGALAAGLPVAGLRFTGGPFFWAEPLPLLCGFGLCIGYALMGACWLVGKAEGATRDFGYRALRPLGIGVTAFLVLALAVSLAVDLRVLHRWTERPALAVFPAISLAAAAVGALAWRKRRDHWLFPCGAAIFASAFGTLAASFLPFMVPFSITVDQAAAPPSTLAFMFWGAGVIVLPLTLIYTAAVYWIFRGRVRDDEGYAPALAATAAAVARPAPDSPRRASRAERAAEALSITALVALSLRNVLRRRR